MSDVLVRPLRWPDDRAAVAAIDASYTADALCRIIVDEIGVRLQTVRRTVPFTKVQPVGGDLAAAAPPWEHAVVAAVDGRVRGVAGTHLSRWNNRQVLDSLYVDGSARGRGLARLLVAEMLAEARSNGARQLWLETQDANAPAIAAYRRLGFHPVGCDTTLYGPPFDGETAIYLARSVDP